MKIVQKTISGIDSFQRRHRPFAFGYAVIKKYGEDQAGYQAALVTYYGFLSLFPLLLVLTTVAGIVSYNNPQLGQEISDSVATYFPIFSGALEKGVNTVSKSGPALLIGLLFTLYGARGIADAFRNAVNHIWHVPLARRSGFPRSLLRSIGLIIGGGLGFIAASIITGWITIFGHSIGVKGLTILVNVTLLYLVFLLILRLSLPLKIARQQFRMAAIISAAGVTVLQIVGTALLRYQTDHLASTYGALVVTTLGLMAWIYLQAQIVMYACVINTTKNDKWWPRSLSGDNPTAVDKQVTKRQKDLLPTHYR